MSRRPTYEYDTTYESDREKTQRIYGIQLPSDSLNWPLLTVEEREFLEDRGFTVITTAIGSQSAFVPKFRRYVLARAVLDFCLSPWGGDPVYRSSPWKLLRWEL